MSDLKAKAVTQRPKRGAVDQPHSLWTRLLAVFCLVLVAAVGTAQAVHIHGAVLPENDASQPSGPEHCPLCVTLHSALPVTLRVDPTPMRAIGYKAPVEAEDAADSHWHYAMFSRPPPAVETL